MNRARALSAFKTYIAGYNPTHPRIALKVEHTRCVAELCERIAFERGLSQDDIDLAWLLGLLHDIGRFEQVRRFDTFNDAASVNHAALGVEVLFGESSDGRPRIRSFIEDPHHDELIRLAVGTHSAYRLPDGLDERTRDFCNILRDADKIDILRVNCARPVEDIYGVSDQDMASSKLSPACADIFYERRCIPRDARVHPADIMLSHICFAWELVFPASRRVVQEQGYLAQMLARTWTDPETSAAFEDMSAFMAEDLKSEFGPCA